MSDREPTRVLFVGDMHLGRRPTGVPEAIADATPLGPEEAWRRTVQLAIAQRVDAVALAGDLVHQDNARFEAFGHLQPGVEQLAAAGIAVCAVAGNHDTDSLPGLAGLIEGFHLLGSGGTWSEWVLRRTGATDLRLVGWSFPAPHHGSSPLASPPPVADAGYVTLGLLHADLDASGSRYAPVRATELQALNYAGWFLGHVHKPQPIPHPGTPFYLGSLSPLDPSETGLHGPLLVTLDAHRVTEQRRIPLAPLRWAHLDWDAAEIDADDDLAERLLARVVEFAQSLGDELREVAALGVRLRIDGHPAEPARLERRVRALDTDLLSTALGGMAIFVQKIEFRATGQHNLSHLAERDDPPGLLARQLLILQGAISVPGIGNAPAAAAEWMLAARNQLESVDRAAAFAALDSEPLTDEQLRDLLVRVGQRTLDRMLEPLDGAHETP